MKTRLLKPFLKNKYSTRSTKSSTNQSEWRHTERKSFSFIFFFLLKKNQTDGSATRISSTLKGRQDAARPSSESAPTTSTSSSASVAAADDDDDDVAGDRFSDVQLSSAAEQANAMARCIFVGGGGGGHTHTHTHKHKKNSKTKAERTPRSAGPAVRRPRCQLCGRRKKTSSFFSLSLSRCLSFTRPNIEDPAGVNHPERARGRPRIHLKTDVHFNNDDDDDKKKTSNLGRASASIHTQHHLVLAFAEATATTTTKERQQKKRQ